METGDLGSGLPVHVSSLSIWRHLGLVLKVPSPLGCCSACLATRLGGFAQYSAHDRQLQSQRHSMSHDQALSLYHNPVA